jgi:ABC-type transport system involved in multi-copper enzyme maturation permease subunit
MIWLTWRQFRAQAVVVLIAVGLLAVALAATRPGVAALQRESPADFLDRFATETGNKVVYFIAAAVVYAVPAVIGAFWGAPLVAREVESGTLRLVWTQSVPRHHWLATKLGVVALAALVVGSISLVVTWWCGPLDTTVSHGQGENGFFSVTRLSGVLLGARGLVPVGYAVLALVVGVAIGLVVRRTVAAMALTFVAVIAVQVVMPVLVQPHLLSPVRITTSITPDNLRGMFVNEDGAVHEIRVRVDEPGAWVTANRTVDAAGADAGPISVKEADCTPDGAGQRTEAGPTTGCFEALAAGGFRQQVEYQPASRYWLLQWIQTGILVGAAALLAGFCFWRVRRDLA